MTARLRAVALVALVGSLLPAASALVVPSPATAADPMFEAPAVGACYDVSYRQAQRELTLDSAPVDCAGRHTMRVVQTPTLPGRLSWESPRAKVYAAAHEMCTRAARKAVGASRTSIYLTLYTPFYFFPDRLQRDAGARWVNCLVGLTDEDGMVPLPAGELPRATRQPADSVAWCLTRRIRVVSCTARHSYRATRVFLVRAKGTPKQRSKVGMAAGSRRCGRLLEPAPHAWYWLPHDARRLAVVCFRHDRDA